MPDGDPMDTEAVRGRVEAAAPGPWSLHNYYGKLADVLSGNGHIGKIVAQTVDLEDASFIAHAITDIPALLDALAESQEREARLRGELEEAQAAIEDAVVNRCCRPGHSCFAVCECWDTGVCPDDAAALSAPESGGPEKQEGSTS